MHFEKFTTTGVQFIFNIIFVSLNWIPACKWVYGWLVERYWCQQRFTLTFIAALKWIRWHWNRVSIILEAIDSVLHSACKIGVHFLCYFFDRMIRLSIFCTIFEAYGDVFHRSSFVFLSYFTYFSDYLNSRCIIQHIVIVSNGQTHTK